MRRSRTKIEDLDEKNYADGEKEMDVERRWWLLRGQKAFGVLIEWDRTLSKIRDPRISSPLVLYLCAHGKGLLVYTNGAGNLVDATCS